MPDHSAYLKKVALSSLFNSATSALATAVLLPFVIKSVGLAAYGAWAVLAIFIGIASALDFGIWKSLVYLIPRAKWPAGQLFWSAVLLCTLSGLAFTFVLGVLLYSGASLFGTVIEEQGNLMWWLAASGCIIVFASLLTNLARGMLEASYRGHWVNVGYGLLTVCQYGAAAIMAHWTHDPRALIASSTIIYVISLIAHAACVIPGLAKSDAVDRKAMASMLRYGGALFVAEAPSILLGPLVLYLFLLVANTGREYGAFDIALRIATLAATTLGMLSTPFFTMVATVTDSGRSEVRSLIARHLRITAALAACGWITYWAVGRPLLAAFFVEGSRDIYRASLIMLMGTAAVAALEPVTRMMMGIGRLGILSLIRFAMLAAALLCVALLVRIEPLDRFSISYAVGFGIAAIGLLMLNKKERWGFAESV